SYFLSSVLACLCLLHAQAQSTENQQLCERVSRNCLQNEARLGRDDIITRYLNPDCRRRISTWTNISRCQLERAAC
ncbi:hypothetical protein KR222_010785, partial [Zaprionus bogoriensis]